MHCNAPEGHIQAACRHFARSIGLPPSNPQEDIDAARIELDKHIVQLHDHCIIDEAHQQC